MPRANVSLICSKCEKSFYHTSSRVIPSKELDGYIDWAKNTINTCPECWKTENEAKKLAEREKQSAKDAETVQECPWILPNLTGTEKQVKWANDIRNNLLAQMISKKVNFGAIESAAKDELPPDVGNREKLVKTSIEFMEAIYNDSAKWWIDNRGKSFFEGRICIGVDLR